MAPKKGSSSSELEFKQLLRLRMEEIGVWSECYEPRSGSGTGIPDLHVMSSAGLLPVEVKVGEIDGLKLFCSEIRPSQISWHDRFFEGGGKAMFIVGVRSEGGWDGFALAGTNFAYLSHWRVGFRFALCPMVMKRGQFTTRMRKILGK